MLPDQFTGLAQDQFAVGGNFIVVRNGLQKPGYGTRLAELRFYPGDGGLADLDGLAGHYPREHPQGQHHNNND